MPDQEQQEAEEIEARDHSAVKKGRVPLAEEVSPLGQRVLGVPEDSFTSSAKSQDIDQANFKPATDKVQ